MHRYRPHSQPRASLMWTINAIRAMTRRARRPERLRQGRTVPRRREHRLRTGRRGVPGLRGAVPATEIRPGGMLIIDDVHRYLPFADHVPGFAAGAGDSCDRGMGAGGCDSRPVAADLDEERRIRYGDLREGVRRRRETDQVRAGRYPQSGRGRTADAGGDLGQRRRQQRKWQLGRHRRHYLPTRQIRILHLFFVK